MSGEYQGHWTDRAIGWAFPSWGRNRMRSRMEMQSMSRSSSRLERLRKRGRKAKGEAEEEVFVQGEVEAARKADVQASLEQVRCNPLAVGIVTSKVNHVVGGGFRLQPRVEAKVLELEREDAEEYNDMVLREWQTHFSKTACDFDDHCDFAGLTSLAFRSMLETGDAFVLLRRDEASDSLYKLKLQVVPGHRVATPRGQESNKSIKDGVGIDEQGRPRGYYIANGGSAVLPGEPPEYQFMPARDLDGRPNVIHLFNKIRAGQYRGDPALTPVLTILETIGEYIENEVDASRVASLFTAFVKTQNPGEDLGWESDEESGYEKAGNELKSGAIMSLGMDEDVTMASPNRPNSLFEGFMTVMEMLLGIGAGIPYEVYTGRFTSSYSASRAALVLGEINFKIIRKLIVERFCRPVYAEWYADAVAMGRIDAPRFDARDPIAMDAYLRSEWIGPGAPQLDAEKEAKAFVLKDQNNFSSLQQIIQEMNGGDWKRVLDQIKLEQEYMEEIGLTRSQQSAPSEDGETEEPPVDEETVDEETPDQENVDEEDVDNDEEDDNA